MFENLMDKLNAAFQPFRNKGKLTEADVKAGMRQIKLALRGGGRWDRIVRHGVDFAVADQFLIGSFHGKFPFYGTYYLDFNNFFRER